MITAIVLIGVDPARIPETAREIADLPGVAEVYSVTGDHDLIAIVRVREYDGFTSVISDQISKTEGVRATTTHLAFKAYSQRELDAAFDIGVD